MSKIFISHSSHDNAKALALAQWLKEKGWGAPFLDISPKHGVAPVRRWREELTAAAGRCEAVICLLAPAWLQSAECRGELSFACYEGKSLIGVVIDPTIEIKDIPDDLRSWQVCNLVKGEERHLFNVHHDPLVPPTVIDFAENGLVQLHQGLQASSLNPFEFQYDPKRAPYRGLKALEAEDAAIFFGRDAEIVGCLDRLRKLRQSGGPTLLILLGASGAGKSSFLRAGLWPRLDRNDRDFLPVPVIRPERAVVHGESGLAHSLSKAFAEHKSKKNLAEIRSELATHSGFERLLIELQELALKGRSTESKPPTIILPIDQGEELFLSEGREEGDLLLSYLGQSLSSVGSQDPKASAERPHIIAIIAIRSDSYEPLQTHHALRFITREQFDLLPIARDDYKELILKPAERATKAGRKLTVDPDLVKALRDTAEGADALPLLAYTLERLFIEHGGDGDLRLEEYTRFGGIKEVIDQAVASAFENPEQRPSIPTDTTERTQRLRDAFIPWLARIDPATETRQRRVAKFNDIPAESRTLVERLINVRLLTSDNRVIEGTETRVVEVAHEALLRQWTLLDGWLDDNAIDLKSLETVKQSADEWIKHQRGTDWLSHSGERLVTAEHLLQRKDFAARLGDEGRAYLADCRAKEDLAQAERESQFKKTARMQSRIWKLITAFSFALIAGIVGVTFQSREIGYQTSLVLATAAQTARDAGHLDRALRFAILAAEETWLSRTSVEADPQLTQAVHASAMELSILYEDSAWSTSFSPDGTQIVTASFNNRAEMWDVATGKTLVNFSPLFPYLSFTITGDGIEVDAILSDKTAQVWDVVTGKQLARFAHEDLVQSATFSPDGTQVVTASLDNTARVWDVATGKELARFTHEDRVRSATFSPDGTQVVTVSSDKTARVWNIATGKQLAQLAHEGRVRMTTFSPNGTQVVTASSDKTVRVWNIATGKQLARLAHEGLVQSATFSPDGTKVVTASLDNTARVWDAASGEQLARLTHENSVQSATFSPDGIKVVTASSDRTARVWNVATGKQLARFTHKGLVRSATFSPDGTQVVTASSDETARLWDVASGKQLAQYSPPRPVLSASFSFDGTRVITASQFWFRDIHLLSQNHGNRLLEQICGEKEFKLIGARHISARDVEISPLLSGREGEDVCDPPSWFSRLTKSLGFGVKPMSSSN